MNMYFFDIDTIMYNSVLDEESKIKCMFCSYHYIFVSLNFRLVKKQHVNCVLI